MFTLMDHCFVQCTGVLCYSLKRKTLTLVHVQPGWGRVFCTRHKCCFDEGSSTMMQVHCWYWSGDSSSSINIFMSYTIFQTWLDDAHNAILQWLMQHLMQRLSQTVGEFVKYSALRNLKICRIIISVIDYLVIWMASTNLFWSGPETIQTN